MVSGWGSCLLVNLLVNYPPPNAHILPTLWFQSSQDSKCFLKALNPLRCHLHIDEDSVGLHGMIILVDL